MFKDLFVKLCNQKGVSPSHACGKVGISPAAFSQWKENSIPRQATLQRIADYFGVTVDYLLGNAEKEKPMASSDAMGGEYEKRLLAIWNQIPDKDKPELLKLIEAALRMRG